MLKEVCRIALCACHLQASGLYTACTGAHGIRSEGVQATAMFAGCA